MAENDTNNENLSAAIPEQSYPNTSIINDAGMKGLTGIVGAPSNNPIFDINKLALSAQNYVALNALANSLFGYEFKWFRAVPQERSKDVIFQEYTLSNVDECPLDMKAVVPGGNFPDSKYNYDLMGLEYEIPLEIQIDKKYWESIVGFGTAPQKKDIVYMVLANKLYQVESSYLFRGYMEQETTWKVNLVKYQPEYSRREGDALKETIDIYTVGAEEIFGEAVEAEVKKLVDDTQFSQFAGTSQDKYKKFDTALKTISGEINVYGTIAAQSYYDMRTPTWYDAITYNVGDTITKTTDRSITAWFNPLPSTNKLYNVASITLMESILDPSTLEDYDENLYGYANYTITLDSVPDILSIKILDHVVVSRPGTLNFYARVVAISTNPLQYHCIINPFVLEDLENLTPTKGQWSTQKGYKLQVKEPISILDGENDFNDHVLSVNIYANQYIAINYSHTYSNKDAYVIRMNERLTDNQWYGLVVNIGNTWGQYSTYVWERHTTDKDAKLKIKFYETLRLYPEEIGIKQYTVNKSDAYLTNIRLFSSTIEEEKQANELLSYFSQDGDKLIIGDNGDAIMKLPYISKQK